MGIRKVWRRKGTANDQKNTTPSVKHGGAVLQHDHVWLTMEPDRWCLLMT